MQGTYDYTLTGLGSNAADAPARIQVSIPCGGSVTDPGALSFPIEIPRGISVPIQSKVTGVSKTCTPDYKRVSITKGGI